jgi:uncharacterized protein (DUF427 family)
MSATQQPRLPGPDHPITIEPHAGRVVVRAGGRVVADTTNALALREASYPAVLYLPVADLERSALRDSETTTYCPYKGTASYWSLDTDAGAVEDAVWYYPEPYGAVGEIADHAAFYADRVSIEELED